jgi:hypothetical protein
MIGVLSRIFVCVRAFLHLLYSFGLNLFWPVGRTLGDFTGSVGANGGAADGRMVRHRAVVAWGWRHRFRTGPSTSAPRSISASCPPLHRRFVDSASAPPAAASPRAVDSDVSAAPTPIERRCFWPC